MRPLLLFFFILIGYDKLSAQDPSGDSSYITIKSGNKVEEVLKPADIYYYPQFTNGQVFYRGGTKGTAKLNYTRVHDEMLFINPTGDTLALGNEKTIKFIVIGRDTFYYDEGYVKIISDNKEVKFAEKQVWVVVNLRKPGPHNSTSSSASVTSVRSYRDGNEVTRNNLTLNEDIVLRKETQYYIGDEYYRFVRPVKKKLHQLFPKEERSLDNYFKANQVDINKKEDLEKLFHFLTDLL